MQEKRAGRPASSNSPPESFTIRPPVDIALLSSYPEQAGGPGALKRRRVSPISYPRLTGYRSFVGDSIVVRRLLRAPEGVE